MAWDVAACPLCRLQGHGVLPLTEDKDPSRIDLEWPSGQQICHKEWLYPTDLWFDSHKTMGVLWLAYTGPSDHLCMVEVGDWEQKMKPERAQHP